MNILIGIVFKPAGDISMEMDPVFPVQEEHADADQIGHVEVYEISEYGEEPSQEFMDILEK